MKYLIIVFLLTTKLYACDCEVPKPILEFYNSEYVFEGIISSEGETEDMLTYTLSFDIIKHYKESNYPTSLKFTLALKDTYNASNSCVDRPIRIGEKWLVYAYKDEIGKLKFDFYCSNTKQIFDKKSITPEEYKVLQNGNSFSLSDYIYESQDDFTEINFEEKLEKILKNLNNQNNKQISFIKNKKTASVKEQTSYILYIRINDKGMIETVTDSENYSITVDENFNLLRDFKKTEKKNFKVRKATHKSCLSSKILGNKGSQKNKSSGFLY